MLNEDNPDVILVTSSQLNLTSSITSDKKNSNSDLNQCRTITNLLKNNNDEYAIIKNKKKVSSGIWLKFGLPARKKDKNSNQYDVIPNYSSCFKCFHTYRFIDSCTSSMRDHKRPQEISKGQQQLTLHHASPTLSASSSSSSSRSIILSQIIKQKKENIKKLFVQWVVTSMRPFQIISDSGLEVIMQECLNIGRELHMENVQVEQILCTDRTVRNELVKQAELERKGLQQLIFSCAQSGRLSISPDIWTDNYRKIVYLGATAHMVDEKFVYYSFDLFCTEFKDKKTGENILKLIQEQLSLYKVDEYMDLITFVTDRGSNFIKGLKQYRLMFCVVHRLNGILKKTFFQFPTTNKQTPTKSQSIVSNEMTPMKTSTVVQQPSPEIMLNDDQIDEEEKIALEEWNDEDDDAETIDYSMLNLSSIPWNAQEIIETIRQSMPLISLKTNLNRQIQLLNEARDNDEQQQHSPFTTIHQCSQIRWLSVYDLLESIKRSHEPLRALLLECKQSHRIEKINMVIVNQLIDFFQPWRNVLKELQRGNAPSLYVVFPCINYLQEDLRKRERQGKSGKI
ncbi:unnamed protein product [Rotaria sordida]|uniref:Hermes trasposase DNA-binding domain-containing protein n=1 Tax=Rotaria sordida TaxID=392033 RepID=A0A815NKD6_9BILA|nr:unnamed protein product [Rotaria sordida]CAF1434389.1 unnamed protein product [Rotaria sordida]